MSKNYTPPTVLAVPALSEGKWRALLTPILLSPPQKNKAEMWLYTAALEAFFNAECQATLRTLHCFAKGDASPQRYRTDIHRLSCDLLTATQRFLRPHGFSLSVTLHGSTTYADICPRYLLTGITHLLRSALQNANAAHITADTTAFRFMVHGNLAGADVQFPRAAAALHGGRVLQCDNMAAFSFVPQITKTAYPHWQSPGIDGLLRNPLSCVRTAFSSCIHSPGFA